MAPRSRIICIGSRLIDIDAAGPRVFDRLAARPLPAGVAAVDGGRMGVDLARFLDDIERAVFVDAVEGFAPQGSLVELSADEAAAAAPRSYGHAGGLPFLLGHLAHLVDGPAPSIVVLGIEGPATDDLIARAAERSLALATTGEIRDGASVRV